MAKSVVARRVPWGTDGVPTDPRARILDAAARCLSDLGLERTSLTAIATEAGVSRQTIYKYFPSREEIVVQAAQKEASAASERIMAAARSNDSAAGYVVELCIAALAEFKRNPAIAPMFTVMDQVDARGRLLSPGVIALARHFLEPILSYLPMYSERLDEMTETFLRLHLSLLTYDSPMTESESALRGYLHRVLVPALGLPPKD